MKLLRIVLPVIVVGAAVAIAVALFATSPEPKRHSKPRPLPVVEVIPLERADHPSVVHSQGTVEPRTQTTLVAEVSGKILTVSQRFRAGSYFKHGDMLVTIDPRNYENAVTVAEAELALKQVNLDQEIAQAEQAKRDWERLGEGGNPSDLVLRKPQLAAARAAVAAARARLAQAKTDLERTRIRAPYDGRVLEKQADIGQFVTLGSPLGSIYATDLVEIKLPVSEQALTQLEIPERYEGDNSDAPGGASVQLRPASRNANPKHRWQGKVVRVSGALDPKTRQPFVVAQVENPYKKTADSLPPLKIGQFVKADIIGKTIEDAYKIPASALTGKEILTLDEARMIHKIDVTLVAKEQGYAFVKGDIPEGYRLVITALPLATEGMQVKVKGEEQPSPTPATEAVRPL